MKIKMAIVVCLALALGAGVYLLSTPKQDEPRAAAEWRGAPPTDYDLAGQEKNKLWETLPQNEKKETRAPDGRIIVKGALPPKLKKLDNQLRELAEEIKRDREKLDKQAKADLGDGKDMEKIIREADQIIEKVNAKHGFDTALAKAEYQKKLQQPITDPQAKAIIEDAENVGGEPLEIKQRLNTPSEDATR